MKHVRAKFLIIGGGISGLSAAFHLIRAGETDFCIVEARKRLGGRILSRKLGANTIDLGASFIHGTEGNALFELALRGDLLSKSDDDVVHAAVALTETGLKVPADILKEVYDVYSVFFARCETYFNNSVVYNTKPPAGLVSVGQHLKADIDAYLDKFINDPDGRLLRSLVFDYLLSRECCISGCHSMDLVDLIGIGSYDELSGGNIILPGGFASILCPLIQELPAHNIFMDSPVTQIVWNSTEQTPLDEPTGSVKMMDSESRPCRATVICADRNISFHANHVICTLPLGVLKSSQQIFIPRLPVQHSTSIDRLHFGSVDKIFLHYTKTVLSPEINEIVLLWNKHDANDGKKESWYKGIYSFTKFSNDVLVGWITGDSAEYMESLSMATVAETCTTILRSFLRDPKFPRPTSCLFTTWRSQPFSQGSYSYIGVDSSQADIVRLAEPLFTDETGQYVRNSDEARGRIQPVVVFAGEHCHPTFYSTTHGAYLSGRSAVQFLVASNAKQKVVSGEADIVEDELKSANIESLSHLLSTATLSVETRVSKMKNRRDNGHLLTPR